MFSPCQTASFVGLWDLNTSVVNRKVGEQTECRTFTEAADRKMVTLVLHNGNIQKNQNITDKISYDFSSDDHCNFSFL